MLLKVIKEKQPDLLAIAFDPKGSYPTPYRIQGIQSPSAAHAQGPFPQIPYIHKLVEAFRIPVFVVEGQEADDVIATLARRRSNSGWRSRS